MIESPNYNFNLGTMTDFHYCRFCTAQGNMVQVTVDVLSCHVQGFNIKISSL